MRKLFAAAAPITAAGATIGVSRAVNIKVE